MSNNLYFLGALLATAGGALAFYFHRVYKGKISGHQWWIPSYLQISSKKCLVIVDSVYGRHFGIANAKVGIPLMFIYAILLTLTGLKLISNNLTFTIGFFTILIGGYLCYGLWRLKTHCRICYTIHLTNLLIFILQLFT